MKIVFQFMNRTWLLFFLVTSFNHLSFSQSPFSCPSIAYQVAGDVSLGSVSLYSYNINTGERILIKDLERSINAIAYNPVDNMIWGFDQNTFEFVRIDSTGAMTDFTIPGLPNNIYNSADFLPGGYLLFYRTDTGTTTLTYYMVDLNASRPATYLKLVDPTQAGYPLESVPYGTSMTQLTLTNDMAYNPTLGVMVGVGTGANNRKIVRLDPESGTVTVNTATITGDGFETTAGPYGAAFTDAGSSEHIYIFANTPGAFYRINLTTNTATKLSNSIIANNNDGASCPTAILSLPISGNVFTDLTADNTVNGTGTNAGGLNAVLYDNTTGKVVAVEPVNADGTYTFGATPGNNYSVLLTTTTPTMGQTTPPAPSLPTGLGNTGDHIGTSAGTDGSPDGVLVLGTLNTAISNVNFGIRSLTPFTCASLAYQVAGDISRGPVSLYSYNINTGDRVLISALERSINAIAYNPVDNMIWGFDQNTFELVSIDANGTMKDFTIPDLPQDIYNSADFLPGGYLLLYRTDTGTGTLTYYVVDLNSSRPATYLKLVDPTLAGYPLEAAPFGTTMSQLTLTNDMAYNPTRGVMVGVGTGTNNQKIVTLDPETGTVTVTAATVTGEGFEGTAGPYGAAFADAGNSNKVFIFANNPGSFYSVDLTSNTATLLSNSITAANNDGASCPTAILSLPISGNVFNDASADNTVNGTGFNPGGLNAVLYDNTTGKVVAVHPVNADGTYQFGATPNNLYSVYLTTSTPVEGQTSPPTPSLPVNWFNRNEKIGTTAGNDGNTDGVLVLPALTAEVTNVNFGITNDPLPVRLVDFSVHAQVNGSVLVTWKTTWEEGNKSFVIEKSKDSQTFIRAGEISDVAGSSKDSNNYAFVDSAPFQGTSYYRLRQIDLDGTENVYRIKSVIVDATYQVYPNPLTAANEIIVTLDEPATAEIQLHNINGIEIKVGKSDEGNARVKLIPSAPLESGIYIITVKERGNSRTYRLLVH